MKPKPVCEITAMEVDRLSEEHLFRFWMEKMPESRRVKTNSLRSAESQRLSLGVGILLFRALQRRGIDGTRAEIREGEYGKPFLTETPEIHFSLSHAGNWALCAVSGQPLGCDVERTGRADRRIPGRFFHPEEQAALAALKKPEEWEQLFGRIWTRKESYLKAVGRGLSLPMGSFSVLGPPEGVWYDQTDLAEGYAFSCCVLGEERPRFSWKTETLE